MEGPLPHQFPAQHLHDNNLFHPPTHHNHPSLIAQLDLDPTDPFHFNPHLEHPSQLQTLHPRQQSFEQAPPAPRFQEIRSQVPTEPRHSTNFNRGGQFGVLTPHPPLPSQPQSHHEALGRLQNEIDLRPVPVQDGGTTEGHFGNLKLVPNPPNLEEWRKRLFEVNELITLTEDEYASFLVHRPGVA